ncbi:MAG: DUF1223 domain-containing protein [Alphaproteobacteria bacterium]
MIRFLFILIFITPSLATANPVLLEYIAYPGCAPQSGDHAHEDHSDADHIHHVSRFKQTPPEETFANTIQKHPDIIAFTCYLDYSSYEIKDREARKQTVDKFCADRSYMAFKTIHKDEEFSTGDMIINGRKDTSGLYQNVIDSAITFAAAQDNVQAITLNKSGETLSLALPKIKSDTPLALTLLGLQNTKIIDPFEDPENPYTVTYHNVVTAFKRLPQWDGAAQSISTKTLSGDKIIAFAQNEETGKIVAAGKF